MKIHLTFLLLLGLTISASAQWVTNKTARFKTKVISYEGKAEPGVSHSTSISPSPFAIERGSTNTDSITTAGHESELTWTFVARNRDKDVYHFTFSRTMKVGSSNKTTMSKDVSFDGKRIVIFEDDLHTVLMESPSEEDLKDIAKRNPI